MEEIKAWLNSNRPYDAGAKLYLQHGKDSLLRMLFKEDYSEFKKERLAEALENLLNDGKVQKNEGLQILAINPFLQFKDDGEDYKLPIEVPQPKPSVAKGWPPVKDEIIQSMYDQWKPLFLEKKNLQARIYEVALVSEEEAGKMAHRILDLRDACAAIYKQRDYYLQHNNLPEKEAPLPNLVSDPKKHPKSLANHQRYLRDYNAKWRNAKTDEERERIRKNIELQQRYVDHYKKMLE